jgi:hypothetical protein
VLPTLGEAHSEDGEISDPIAGADLFCEAQDIVKEHGTDDTDYHPKIDTADPPIDFRANTSACDSGGGIDMNLALGEIGCCARVTLAARLDEMIRMDCGARIGRGQNPMIPMATGAIGGECRAVLGSETVITGEKCFYAIARKLVFGIQTFGCMAFATNFR